MARAREITFSRCRWRFGCAFNPNLDPAWFGGVMAIINNITMLAIVLTGSALIREREHGTVEHLLVMPVTPFEIMMAKVWSMGLVVLVVSGLSLMLMVKGVLGVPIEGSIPLFMLGVALSLFATTSIGILWAPSPVRCRSWGY